MFERPEPTLGELAGKSRLGWLSSEVVTRVFFPLVLRKIPLPSFIKRRAPVLRVVSKWPDAVERLKEMRRNEQP